MAALGGKLTKKLVENAGPGRHGDGAGLYLVVDPSKARRWIVRVTVKGQKNRKGAPLRTDFGLGGADVVTLNQARERALEYRRMAKSGLNPRFNASREIPTFEELARQVHIDRLPTWKNAKHATNWLRSLEQYAFPKIGRMPVDTIGQPEALMCLAPIWTSRHDTARKMAQRMKAVLDVAKSKGFRSGENPISEIRDGDVLPKVKHKQVHLNAMPWADVPAFYAELSKRTATAAKALMFTILTACRTSEVLLMKWDEVDFESRIWTVPADRMKAGYAHRVPLTDEMISILEQMQAMASEYVFEGQRRNKPLSNMSMLMMMRRMKQDDFTVHGFRSAFRDWASEAGNAPREIAEIALAHQVGSEVERAYRRSDLLSQRQTLMTKWSAFVNCGHRYV